MVVVSRLRTVVMNHPFLYAKRLSVLKFRVEIVNNRHMGTRLIILKDLEETKK